MKNISIIMYYSFFSFTLLATDIALYYNDDIPSNHQLEPVIDIANSFEVLPSKNSKDLNKLEQLSEDLQSFENWANPENEQLAGLALNSSTDLKLQSQNLNQLIVKLLDEITSVKNYWGRMKDTIHYEGLLCRVSVFDEKVELLRTEAGLFQNKLIRYHDIVLKHEKTISGQFKVAKDKAAYYRQQERKYNTDAANTKNRQKKATSTFMAVQEGINASHHEATSSKLASQLDTSQKLLKILNGLQTNIPTFRGLISNIHSNNISIKENATKTSNAAYSKETIFYRKQLKHKMITLFNLN